MELILFNRGALNPAFPVCVVTQDMGGVVGKWSKYPVGQRLPTTISLAEAEANVGRNLPCTDSQRTTPA